MKITKVFFRLKKGLKYHLSVYYLYIFMKNIRWDFFFSYPLLCFSRFFSWLKTQTKIGICSSWTLWSTVEIWAWHPPLPHTIFLSLEFRVGDTCSTKRKSRHQEEEDQRAHTKRRYCVCYAPQFLVEEEEVWLLLPRESGSRPHDYTRDPCRSKGHAHNRDHGGFSCFDD